MYKWRILLVAAILLLVNASALKAEYLCSDVRDEWQWFGDHFGLKINYVVVGKPNRYYEVGTGMSVGGVPRGRKRIFSGSVEVRAFAFGAIHVRQVDEGPPFKVCISSDNLSPVKLLEIEF